MEDVKGDFRKLLEMMAALYNLRTGGADKELHIDQMQVYLLFLSPAHLRILAMYTHSPCSAKVPHTVHARSLHSIELRMV